MAGFKGHKVQAHQLLKFIPEGLLASLSMSTQVDHYTKVLHGKKMFYLLLFGLAENDKLSQRTLEDTFNDPAFKLLFDLDKDETVCRSSISERLSKIDPDYFKQIFECTYEQFSKHYRETDTGKHNIIRVDSSMVSDTAGKLLEGISNNGKKAVKYSVAFDGVLPCGLQTFTAARYSSEDVALPEAVLGHVKKEQNGQDIYVLDRGIQSTRTMKAFAEGAVKFICRAKEDRKYEEVESLISHEQDMDFGESTLIKDAKVKLYTGMPIKNKRGKIHFREELVDTEFRLIIIERKAKEKQQYWFLTNDMNLSAKEIAQAYRRRWDIEVFFRFIKQELNVSHLVSMNKNGIQVIMYMTMIMAMLILIYKKANEIGYKTAKRRFAIEVRNLVIALIAAQCGGDPDLMFKT